MKTLYTRDTKSCAAVLRSGGLVAVPTETVYGLAADGLNAAAVSRVYEVKGRPEQKPLALMVSGVERMADYCEDIPPQAYELAERYWPGPLTIVLKARDCVPDIVRAGGDTVGLRCPDHALTLDLLREYGGALAVPSANPSGMESAVTVSEVRGYFDGNVEAVLDGGDCVGGVASTLISLAETPYKVLREGALSCLELENTLADNMRLVGITGGSGTGKTTALRMFERHGALCIDADALYHRLTAESEGMRKELTERFGAVYEGKVLQRKKLGAVVFGDAAALLDLNRITHKYVSEGMNELLRAHAMNGGRLAVIDAVALIESGINARCVATFGVVADKELRIARIMQREGIDEVYARARIEAQKSDDYYREHCTEVLENNGSKEEFEALCAEHFNRLIN